MTKLHTLTVPDMLWINLQITGAPGKFSFAKLEEGTFCQFGHGSSRDLAGQAARFLTGFAKLAPLSDGNAATAFVGCLAFLEINGATLDLDDPSALAWTEARLKDPSGARDAFVERLRETQSHDDHGVPDSQQAVRTVLDRYPATVSALAGIAAGV